jgi:cobalt-zinc-cadmium resistance protein CzcA
VQVNPDKLISYGLGLPAVEQALANNNTNSGGSFIQEGGQQINVRQVGLFRNVINIGETVLKNSNGTAIHVRDLGFVTQGPKIRLGRIGKAIHRKNGVVFDNPDTIEGIVLLRKGANGDAMLTTVHDEVIYLNERFLPPGVKIVPFLDRSDLVRFTTHTVIHNLTEGILLVSIILFLFLGNLRSALILVLTIPFSLLFASVCLDLGHVSANLLSLGALDFG